MSILDFQARVRARSIDLQNRTGMSTEQADGIASRQIREEAERAVVARQAARVTRRVVGTRAPELPPGASFSGNAA